MYLRVLAFGGLLGCMEAVAESIVGQRGFANVIEFGQVTIGIIQSYAFGNIIFFGITYGFIAIIVSLLFDYEPSPRRFKRSMALALFPLALVLTVAGIQNALRYPTIYNPVHLIAWIAHLAGVLWLSQYIAGYYLRELAISNQE